MRVGATSTATIRAAAVILRRQLHWFIAGFLAAVLVWLIHQEIALHSLAHEDCARIDALVRYDRQFVDQFSVGLKRAHLRPYEPAPVAGCAR